ncbi:UNVERIFIED_CONTAM: hypothetical protein FKN15_072952 [Acipenser sinensis]
METEQRAGSREVQYPAELSNAQSKRQHKISVLRDNPECLYSDYTNTGGKRIKNNLIFHTEHTQTWHAAICSKHRNIKKRGIWHGRQITVGEDSDPDSTVLTINIYQNGTVVIQGNEASLDLFEKSFQPLKEEVESKKTHPATTDPDDPGPENTAPITDDTPDASQLPSSTQYLRESLAQLELEFAEFRELTLASLSEASLTQQLRDEVSQVKRESRVAVSELITEVRNLQLENEDLRAQLASVMEDMKRRERTHTKELQGLREQLYRHTAPPRPTTHTNAPQQQLSYAAALAQPPPHAPNELGEIRQLLSMLCSRLLN